MKCPKCQKENKKSKVFVDNSTETLMAGKRYYDEEGNFHHHDPNIITTLYHCSNGHEWKEERKLPCPCSSCDYGSD